MVGEAHWIERTCVGPGSGTLLTTNTRAQIWSALRGPAEAPGQVGEQAVGGSIDPVRTLHHHLETCEALPMGGVKVACTIAKNRLDWNDVMLHFRA